MSQLRALFFSLFVALLLAGCEGDYTLPPTACDDYCHATQRGGCRDDAPAACVRDCEASGEGARTECSLEWQARNDCLLRADASSFQCQDNHSQLPDICLEQRRALSECAAPGSGACFDECLRQVESCGASLQDCEAACREPSPSCLATSSAYNACLQGYPVECRDYFMEDTREPADIPCFYEALAVLACK